MISVIWRWSSHMSANSSSMNLKVILYCFGWISISFSYFASYLSNMLNLIASSISSGWYVVKYSMFPPKPILKYGFIFFFVGLLICPQSNWLGIVYMYSAEFSIDLIFFFPSLLFIFLSCLAYNISYLSVMIFVFTQSLIYLSIFLLC